MIVRVVLLLLALAVGSLSAQPSVTRRPLPERHAAADRMPARVAIAAAGESGITIEVTGLRYAIRAVGDTAFVTTNAPGFEAAHAANTIPALYFTLGVPYDAENFSADVLPSRYDTAAIPARARLSIEAVPIASVSGTAVQRGMRTVVIRYQPARLEGGVVRAASAARIVVAWHRGVLHGAPLRARAESASMEQILRGTILNYDQAKAWRGVREAPRASRAMSTGAGIGAGTSGWGMEQGVVITSGSDGIVGVSGADLAASGATGLLGTQISQLRLRNHLATLSFFVADRNGNGALDAEDTLEFAARRSPSEEPGFYFSDVTDTNAYILSWHGGTGAGAVLAAKSGSGSAPVLGAYDSTLHFEQENVYFPGISDPNPFWGDVRTIHVSGRVQNERFYWARVAAPQQTIVSFNASPALSRGATMTASIRVAGVNFRPHRMRLQLNGIEIGDVTIRDTSDTNLLFAVPASWFINGRNSLVLRPEAIDGLDSALAAIPDITFLDYIEITGRWLPSAWDNAPKVRLPRDASGPVRVAVAGFSAPTREAFSSASRVVVDSVQRGHLIRLTSRQLDVPLRQMPGFTAQIGEALYVTPAYGGGLKALELDGTSGAVLREGFFDLYVGGDQAKLQQSLRDAETFLGAAADGNIVVAGFSVGGGEQGTLPDGLKNIFQALGSTKVFGNNFVASWVFAARKGDPATAMEAYASLGDNDRGVTLDAFIPAPSGAGYRSIVTIEGAGEEFQFGSPAAAPLRYHDADELTGSDNRADMIVISHPAFLDEARRLADHRRAKPPVAGAFDVRVVDVNHIYDEFNDGVKSQVAIRRFVQFADSNWKAPAPGFILLFGDATWDPQHRLPGSATGDYVPTMGIPNTDYLYTVPFADTASFLWEEVIGRLPAATTGDARAMVDKIIEYDTLPPALWNKRFVFMAGGSSGTEVGVHHDHDMYVAETYVLGRTFYGDSALIYRTSEHLEVPDAKDAEWARGEINKGAVWVNFQGHGATDVADLDYGFPEQFDNGNRYFVLATFSCQTGAFAEPTSQVRNERFVSYPGRGAVAAIGATSFSFPQVDNSFVEMMVDSITQPPYHRVLGGLFTGAKYLNYFDQFRFGGWDLQPAGYVGHNALLMYHLLGDPSMKLVTSRVPELALTDVRPVGARGGEPEPGDDHVTVNTRVWNFGMPLNDGDSVTIVATITNPAHEEAHDTVHVDTLTRWADIAFVLPLGKDPGDYTVRLEIDPERHVGETYLRDNDTTFVLRVRGNQVQPIEPLAFGRVAGYDDVVIRLLNPPSGPGARITVDTTPRFDSPDLFTNSGTGSMKLEELATTWTFSIPQKLRSVKTFWWRAATTTGDTAATKLFPLEQSFTVEPAAGAEFISAGTEQMARSQLTNLVNTPAGVGPGERQMVVALRAIGQSFFRNDIPNPEADPLNHVGMNFATALIDGKDYNRPPYDGINMVVFRNGRSLYGRGAFAIYRPEDADAFIAAVDSLKPGDRIFLWSNGQTWVFTNRGAELRQALTAVGMSDSVLAKIAQEDSYALIGGKGIDRALIREKWVEAAPLRAQSLKPPFFAEVGDTLLASPGTGLLVAPVVGPATAWRRLTLSQTGTAAVRAVILGVRRDGTRDTVMVVPAATVVDLSGIDVRIYPRLELRAEFPEDTLLRLGSIAYDFDPAPELAIVPSTVRLDRDSVLQGDPVALNATVANLSRKYAAAGIVTRLSLVRDASRLVIDTLLSEQIPPLDSVRHAYAIVTDRLKGVVALALETNEADVPAEPYRHNNAIGASLKIGLDGVQPAVAIYADGARLMEGDYVVPQPQFEVRITDNSNLRLDDSATMKMILDNDFITITSSGASFRHGDGTGGYRGSFLYTPPVPLAEGRHEIRLITNDATGNSDTTDFITFYVEFDASIRDVVNWPNPFVGKTTFTFMVTGGTPPTGGEIGIYTVAGRKIKTIRLNAAELNIGFNRVEWDGLDDDRDRLANGVYLYKVAVESASGKQEALEKLVIMR